MVTNFESIGPCSNGPFKSLFLSTSVRVIVLFDLPYNSVAQVQTNTSWAFWAVFFHAPQVARDKFEHNLSFIDLVIQRLFEHHTCSKYLNRLHDVGYEYKHTNNNHDAGFHRITEEQAWLIYVSTDHTVASSLRLYSLSTRPRCHVGQSVPAQDSQCAYCQYR